MFYIMSTFQHLFCDLQNLKGKGELFFIRELQGVYVLDLQALGEGGEGGGEGGIEGGIEGREEKRERGVGRRGSGEEREWGGEGRQGR